MILNKSQAEAVSSAMCALNNVSASADLIDLGLVTVNTQGGRFIRVTDHATGGVEDYDGQNAFFAAYGLE